jgi:diguanylate cyclase (GGDEF)-like protein
MASDAGPDANGAGVATRLFGWVRSVSRLPGERGRDLTLLAGYAGVWLALVTAYRVAAGNGLAQSLIFATASFASVTAILLGVHAHRPMRSGAWYWLAAGQTAYTLGILLWYVLPSLSGRPLPFASLEADVVLFQISYVLSAVAILTLIRTRRVGAERTALLDALAITAAFNAILFVFVAAPLIESTGRALSQTLITGFYPVADLVLLLLICRLFFGGSLVNGSLALLVGWATALLLADTVYAANPLTYVVHPDSWVFYVYLVSYLMIGAAALHPRMREVTRAGPERTTGATRLIVVGLCALVVPVLAIHAAINAPRIELIVLACTAAVLFVILMLRVADQLAKTKANERAEHQRLQQFLDAIPVGVKVREADTGAPAYFNPSAISLLGYNPAEVPGPERLPNLYVAGTENPYPPKRLPGVLALAGKQASVDDIEVAIGTTKRRRLRMTGTPLRDHDRIRYVLTSVFDITAEYQMAEELRRLSVIDELTGINNRRGFLLAGRTRLADLQREGCAAVLLFADLDGLKAINDTHGHGVGDQAIRDAASLLSANTLDVDVVGRIGGDEFCVLLANSAAATGIATWVRRLHARAELFNGSNRRAYRISFTVGSSLFDPAAPDTIDELMRRADKDMYRARQARRRVG